MDFTDDETPTSPRNLTPDPESAALVKLYSCLATVERRRLGRMLAHWYACTINRQVIIEEIARELAER